MSHSVRPHRRQPTRLPRPWDFPGKNTGVGCHFLLKCMKMKVKLLSRVRLCATPWTAAYQAPPSMGFSRQEYWNGVPLPSPNFVLVAGHFLGVSVAKSSEILVSLRHTREVDALINRSLIYLVQWMTMQRAKWEVLWRGTYLCDY